MTSHPPRILVVDDEADNRSLLEVILVREGFLVAMAASGEEALVIVGEERPDLILLDLLMAGMNGYETAAELKGNLATSCIPIIMTSAINDLAAHTRALKAGVDGFVPKPIARLELIARIRQLLSVGTPGGAL